MPDEKSLFAYGKTKAQVRQFSGDCAAVQCFWFRYMNSTVTLLLLSENFKRLTFVCVGSCQNLWHIEGTGGAAIK